MHGSQARKPLHLSLSGHADARYPPEIKVRCGSREYIVGCIYSSLGLHVCENGNANGLGLILSLVLVQPHRQCHRALYGQESLLLQRHTQSLSVNGTPPRTARGGPKNSLQEAWPESGGCAQRPAYHAALCMNGRQGLAIAQKQASQLAAHSAQVYAFAPAAH